MDGFMSSKYSLFESVDIRGKNHILKYNCRRLLVVSELRFLI